MKYSFIVPVYNCSRFLPACVDSILTQNSEAYEIVLVDDGSFDGSEKICDQYAEQYPQVTAYHKKNGGASSSRNFGIEKARGDFLLFIDGDDTVDTSLLKTIDNFWSGNGRTMLIYGMAFDYYWKGRMERCEMLSCGHSGDYSISNIFDFFQSFFSDNALSSACNKVFSANIIKTHELRFNEKMTLYEDLDFVLRYLKKIDSVICINRPLYHYRNDLTGDYLKNRVQNLNTLKQNLSALLETGIAFDESLSHEGKVSQLFEVLGNLYIELLVHNLMTEKYGLDELKIRLTDYCDEPHFRLMLASGLKLSEVGLRLLNQIDKGYFRQIKQEFARKKMIFQMKKSVKKIIRVGKP